ncbi:lantibiotic dehydratase [Amycolatopsis sp. GM8]|uniref:lantibiotic dehydratase n=1 Tax=Amycolatopsis sp. GM8 TaxID=2896530 RepID=UPI001F28CACE|nr:lantibiotic dehydratase [Amycolatopsis sp. GM8]
MNRDTTTPADGSLIRLGESEWAMWSSAMVRGAGFPADAVERLADLALAERADRQGAAEDETFRQDFQDAAERFARELGQVARSEQFQLAVGWQNRQLLDSGVQPFLRQLDRGDRSNAKRRRREQTIATYWQRYCLKNESIGFFGPVSWATVAADDGDIAVRTGTEVTDQANVYLERWPVDVLARKLAAEFDLEPWLRPRRSPLLRLTGHVACLPGGTPSPVDDLTLALLRAADGTLTARDLAERLCASSAESTVDSVFALMADLRKRRWLIWKLELSASLTAEDELLALVEGIDDDEIRTAASAQVRTLIDGRERLRRVWNRPAELPGELSRMAESFVELTGSSATRHDGQAYGGRTLAYLECRRDVSVRLGQSFTDRLAPIIPVVDSIRWLTWRIRQDIEPHIQATYAAQRQRTAPGEPVDVASLWMAALTTVATRLDEIVTTALAEFHDRWSAILPYRSDESQVDCTTAELAVRVKEQFDAPHSGWSQARMVCPDVMISADGPDELASGRYQVVLGEIHVAVNSMDYVSLVRTHHSPGMLRASNDAAFPEPRLLPLLPTESRPRFTVRSHPSLIRDEDHRIAMVPHTPLPHTDNVLPAADAVVEQRAGQLTIRTPDGAEFDVMDLFAEAVKLLMLGHFDLLPVAGHRPRVMVDDLVLVREAWRVPVADMDFVHRNDDVARFAATRAWARSLGLPRRVFVKSPTETKPFYVDFASPVFVDMFTSAARRAARNSPEGAAPALKIVEMLPGPDQTWLTGPAGERYTSEFRFALSDLREARGVTTSQETADE